MLILGFQKMTLLDFPGKVACTVFTGGCNFRCPFCHNSALVTDIHPEESYQEEDILEYLKGRKGILDGVAITGGEPLLHTEMEAFLRKIKDMGFAVKMDTNGTFPDRLRDLVDKKLIDYVAVDVKNTQAKYAQTVGVETMDFAPIQKTIRYLLSGAVPFEFRTTVMHPYHAVEDIEEIARMIEGAPRYFLQKFTDSGHLISSDGLCAIGEKDMEKMAEIARKYIPVVEIRG